MHFYIILFAVKILSKTVCVISSILLRNFWDSEVDSFCILFFLKFYAFLVENVFQ